MKPRTPKTSILSLPQNDLQESIHQRHWNERAVIINSLSQSPYPSNRKQSRRLAACGATARFYVDTIAGDVTTSITRCGVRLCPWCTRHRTAEATRQILAAMATMLHPRVIVLTLRSVCGPLSPQLDHLRRAFRRLRSYKKWKDLVTAGIYAIEVTFNTVTKRWHPHVHMIVDGQYFPKFLLTNLWRKASEGSEITWIQDVTNPNEDALELAAYIGKPPAVAHLGLAAIQEYARVTTGLRMLQPFGTLRTGVVDDADPHPGPAQSVPFLTANRIRFLAQAGQVNAARLSKLIALRWPQFAFYLDPESRENPDVRLHADALTIQVRKAELLMHFVLLIRLHEGGELDRYDLYAREQTWLSTPEHT
jgi:hypothetical protein